MEADFRDIHKFEKHVCCWKLIEQHSSCAYSGSECQALRSQQILQRCKTQGCAYRLSLPDCLGFAVEYGSATSVSWLLENGASLLALSSTPHRDTKLIRLRDTAVCKGDFKMLQVLERQGHLIRSAEGYSPVLKACERNDLVVAEWLHALGFEIPRRLGFYQNIKPPSLNWLTERGMLFDPNENSVDVGAYHRDLENLQYVYSA